MAERNYRLDVAAYFMGIGPTCMVIFIALVKMHLFMKKKPGAYANEWYMFVHLFLLLSMIITNAAQIYVSKWDNITGSPENTIRIYRVKIAVTCADTFTTLFMLGLIFKFTKTPNRPTNSDGNSGKKEELIASQRSF